MKNFLPLLLCCINALLLPAQKPVIILNPGAPASERQAAEVLQFYLGKMTGQPVVSQTSQPDKMAVAIFLGANEFAKAYGLQAPPPLTEDVYFMHGKNGAFMLGGGGEMGPEYAAYTLLELLGCRKYSPRDSFIPEMENLRLPDFPPTVETPAFPYRELWYEPASDDAWARWHKLKTRTRKDEEWGMFVHTFDKLCPAKEYFAEHPEYFAFNGAQHSPGQLCLSNDTVLQIVTATLLEKIREKPDARYWSVSQNDNYDYCKCSRCAASDRQYGSPAGTLLAFVNNVAAAFPDKTISTLAYQYTRQAPTGIRPADNVSICLCSIVCNRGRTIEDGCPDFARDVREWSALTSNLMIWDYVVQFRSYLSPFPNWHTLQPNLRFFKENKVQMIFEQGSGRDRSEFSDMRAYLLAKLMWNPDANMDSILTDFGKGYYGAAQPYIWEYIHQLTENLINSDKWLGIYSTPQMEAHSFLCETCVADYLDWMKKAIDATEEGTAERGRAMAASLPLLFAMFELEKIWDNGKFIPDEKEIMVYKNPNVAEANINAFVKMCEASGFKNLHEKGYSPEQYKTDYLLDMKEGRIWHSFLQRNKEADKSPVIQIIPKTPPSTTYEKGDLQKLIDSRRGTDDYHYNWLGFQGNDLDVTLRLPDEWPAGELPEVSTLSVQFLQDQASWVFFPEKVVLEISADGQHFEKIQEENIALVPDEAKAVRRITATFPSRKVRAVRVLGVNTKTCPAWHTCNGNPCWIFVDEIVVK